MVEGIAGEGQPVECESCEVVELDRAGCAIRIAILIEQVAVVVEPEGIGIVVLVGASIKCIGPERDIRAGVVRWILSILRKGVDVGMTVETECDAGIDMMSSQAVAASFGLTADWKTSMVESHSLAVLASMTTGTTSSVAVVTSAPDSQRVVPA